MDPIYFESASDFRDWLDRSGTAKPELLVGFYKRNSGKGGITYPEALDEALCFGWIDGVRRNVDEHRYCIRFTPRRSRSIWSKINIAHAERLIKTRRMHAEGLKAFKSRTVNRSGVYSFENAPRELCPAYKKEFQANEAAWNYFESRPPWYRRVASWWVMSAKLEATRRRRLATLINDSAKGRSIKPLSYNKSDRRRRGRV